MKPENKTERIYIRLTPELKDAIWKAAEEQNRSATNYVENLIKQAIARNTEK